MKRVRWLRSAGGAALVGVLLSLAVSISEARRPEAADSVAIRLSPSHYPFTFAAYGDIRFTDPGNTKPSDPVKRRAIVDEIAQTHPDFVVITGDFVLNGSSKADWKVFDRETAPLRAAHVRIIPALGNHDVRGGEEALKNFFRRFPQLKGHHWYSLRYGNCLFLMLDSDSDESASSPQGEWLRIQLDRVPADVDFVFLALHHPPYTKSSDHFMGGGHSERPQEQQLAKYLEQKAPQLKQKIVVIAGHVHNYERYEHGGVMYLVAGGGGAAQYVIHRSPGDFYTQPGPTYHFCTFKIGHSKLHFEMHKLEPGGDFRVEDQFDLGSGGGR